MPYYDIIRIILYQQQCKNYNTAWLLVLGLQFRQFYEYNRIIIILLRLINMNIIIKRFRQTCSPIFERKHDYFVYLKHYNIVRVL